MRVKLKTATHIKLFPSNYSDPPLHKSSNQSLKNCIFKPPRRILCAMQLSDHDLNQLDEDKLLDLPEEDLRRLSIRLLNDLKEARERLKVSVQPSHLFVLDRT